MAIDYDSGSGLFDKVGKVVSMVNAIETWEITDSSGNLEYNFQALEDVLEDSKEYDRKAKNLMYSKWANYRTALDNMKIRYVELVRLLMASEMVIAENMTSSALQDLLNYLKFAMIRDGKSVVDNSVANSAGVFDTVTSVITRWSKYGTNLPLDTDSEVLAGIFADTLHAEVMSVATPGQEKIRMFGTNPLSSSRGHPNYEYTGIILDNYDIREYNKFNILKNGDLTQVDALSRLKEWTLSSGSWVTDLNMVVGSSGYAISPRVLSIGHANDAKLTQFIPKALLKPNTKYLMCVAFACPSGAGSTDGDFEYGVDASSTTKVSFAITDGEDLDISTLVFNTQDQTKDITAYFQRTGASAGNFQILGVAIYEMTLTSIGWCCFHNSPSLGFANITRPTTLGIPEDQTAYVFTNDHAGKFNTYFCRYLNFLLPIRSGASDISDALVP